MKKIILPMFALTATAMLLPSCSSDDIVPQGDETTVILTAKLPDGLQTRAFADGKTAKHLQMVVLQAEGDRPFGDNLPVFDSGDVYTAEFQNGKLSTEVPVKLVSGKRYAVICWADAGEEKSPYEFNTTTHTVTADYADRTTSDETLDAFYACTTFTVEADGTQTIELRRPFAQLNIGTDDLEVASNGGFTAATAEVTVPVYTELNLVNGEVDAPEVRTFTAAALPTDETFPASAGTGYQYLAMNYVLTSADKTLADEVKLKVTANSGATVERTFNTVPMQRNYRTNIYGSILTSSQNFNVVIEPDFDGDLTSVDVLSDLLNAGKNVKLPGDMTADKIMKIRGSGNVLDLNGKTYSASGPIADWNAKEWSMISLRGGELTITGNGTVKPIAKVDDAFAVDVQGIGTKLIIEGGNYYGNDHVVYVFQGEAEIRGGRFEMLTTSKDWLKDYILNCYDANYKNGTAKITVKGGEFINFNPADCNAEGAHTNFLAPGYVSVKQPSTDGKDHYVVMPGDEAKSIIFGRTIDYSIPAVDVQFSPATANTTLTMAAGGEIKGMQSNANRFATLYYPSGMGGTINGEGGLISANKDNKVIRLGKNTSLTIDGNNTYASEKGYVLEIISSSATIKGGHFRTGGQTLMLVQADKSATVVKLDIQGGVFECSGQLLTVRGTGDNVKKITVEISGGIFVGSQPDAKYLKSGYKFNQTTYNGKTAFEVVPA